jgi:linoleate 10R-lipoxygenase
LCSQTIRFYPVEEEKEKQAVLALLNSSDLVNEIGKFFYNTTKKSIASESYTLVGGKISGVDPVRQVLRVVPIYWVAIDLVSYNNAQ